MGEAPPLAKHRFARRRTPATSVAGRTRHTSQRHEADEVEILSGVYV
jgi:chorismate synthase